MEIHKKMAKAKLKRERHEEEKGKQVEEVDGRVRKKLS